MIDRQNDERHVGSATTLIALLSICLLVAGWRNPGMAEWASNWTLAGASGLAAALGLSCLRRRKARERAMNDAPQVNEASDRSMTTFTDKGTTEDEVREAVRQFVQDFRKHESVLDCDEAGQTPNPVDAEQVDHHTEENVRGDTRFGCFQDGPRRSRGRVPERY